MAAKTVVSEAMRAEVSELLDAQAWPND